MKDFDLTDREKDLLKALKQGNITDEELARALNISVNTVNTHLATIYRKFCLEKSQLRARLLWEVMNE